MEKKLRKFLERYIGQGKNKSDIVTQEAVDMLVSSALDDHIEQEIIDYGNENPDAPFWDFLALIPPGLKGGLTQEELLMDDDDDDE